MAHVVIPFVNDKGGVGKTTLACSYAAYRAKEGVDVLLADTNEGQHTARAWADVRDHNGLLPKVRVEGMSARQALELAGRHDVVVVDTPGWVDRSTLALAQRASFMVIPTGPNPTFELAPTIRLLHGLRAEGIELWRLGVVLSRVQADEGLRKQEEQFARDYLSDAGYAALDGAIPNVAAFGSALAEGYGLSEVKGAAGFVEAVVKVMDSVSRGLRAAERRRSRQSEAGRDRDAKRGDRDR